MLTAFAPVWPHGHVHLVKPRPCLFYDLFDFNDDQMLDEWLSLESWRCNASSRGREDNGVIDVVQLATRNAKENDWHA